MAKAKWPTKAGKRMEIPLFQGQVWCFFSREDTQKAFDILGHQMDLEYYGGIAIAAQSNLQGRVYVIGVFNSSLGVLAHEATHVVQFLCEDVGVEDDETFAYLVQNIFEYFEPFVVKSGETIEPTKTASD